MFWIYIWICYVLNLYLYLDLDLDLLLFWILDLKPALKPAKIGPKPKLQSGYTTADYLLNNPLHLGC